MQHLPASERIPYIFNHCRTIAVVGLSPKPHRASFDVSRYMQAAGYRIIPVNPNAAEVLGEKAYATLREAARHEKIDLVNCFRKASFTVPVGPFRCFLRSRSATPRFSSVSL